jgi:hypothetical protein
MLAMRFLEHLNLLYPNMITFLWYNESMQIVMEMQNFNLHNSHYLIVSRKANVALEKGH